MPILSNFLFIIIFIFCHISDGCSYIRYATSVVPIGAMFAMTLWLGNTAYLYISVAFAQMLKAISKCSLFMSLSTKADILNKYLSK